MSGKGFSTCVATIPNPYSKRLFFPLIKPTDEEYEPGLIQMQDIIGSDLTPLVRRVRFWTHGDDPLTHPENDPQHA
jgi:hypothetical protein